MIIRKLELDEQPLILPLWELCFPDFWEQLAVKNGKLPYEEICFAAFDGCRAVGHCGIIPYTIECGGKLFRMAGIASVATLPEYRHRGIARDLCGFAAVWAENLGFESAPLYTAYFRVYESASWRKLAVPPALSASSGNGASWKRGSELTAQEKSLIPEIYSVSGSFDGKVIRQTSGTLHSWERIFAEPDFLFAVTEKMYSVKADETVIEFNALPDVPLASRKEFFHTLGSNGKTDFLLPPAPEIKELLSSLELQPSPHDPMHGELPMIRDFGNRHFHSAHEIFFPVTDKF